MVTTDLLDGHSQSDDNDILETFQLFWVDSNVNDIDNQNAQRLLRSSLNYLKKFDNGDECRKYLEQSSTNDRFVIIISGRFGREIVPHIHQLQQVSSIYVFCFDKKANDPWASEYSKIKLVTVKSDELISSIKTNLKVQLLLEEPFAIDVLTRNDQNPAIYFLVLVQCLVRMKFNDNDQKELISLLEEKCAENEKQLSLIQEFAKNESFEKVLTWFTPDSIFSRILNRVLFTKDIHRIFLFHSLISHLYFQLKKNQPKSPLCVYRSQVISNDELNKLKANVNQFVCINPFWFANTNRSEALENLEKYKSISNSQRILFEIHIDSTLVNVKPFALIDSSDQSDLVLLMAMSVFHLKSVIYDNKNQIWTVKMSLCTDEEYNSILQSIPIKIEQENEHSNLRTFAKILWQMGLIDLAISYYQRCINELSSTDPLLMTIYDDLGTLYLEQKNHSQSLSWYRKLSEIKKQNPSSIKNTFIDYFPEIGSKISRPPCSKQDACDQLDDEGHMRVYFHRLPCQFAGQCESLDNQEHTKNFTHPEFCPEQGACSDMNEAHLIEFCHVPLCTKGLQCLSFINYDNSHRSSYRHCKINCKLRSYCYYFHNNEHIEEENHPFKQPCPYTPYLCQYHEKYLTSDKTATDPEWTICVQHCFKYSHVCPFGRNCIEKSKKNHCETNLHVIRSECPNNELCELINDINHSNSYSHASIRDIRQLCSQTRSNCPDYLKKEHLKQYRHTGRIDYLGVSRSLGLNKHINFVQNHNQMIESIQKYVQASKWNPSNITISDELRNWIRALQPVHRCNELIFESILLHGHVMSRDHMKSLRESDSVAKAIKHHTEVQRIFSKVPNTRFQQTCEDFIRILVDEHFNKSKGTTITKDQSLRLRQNEIVLKTYLTTEDVQEVRKWTKEISEASLQLHSKPAGIGFGPDEVLGTNKHVFAVLGPHAGYYYGDIILVFRQEIMYHPDSNFSIHAATTFGESQNAYKWRPWLSDPGTPEKRIEHFHQNKLHCSIPGYELAAAYELLALAGLKNKSTKDINLEAIIYRWLSSDSHCVFEAHLPQLIPLNYIEKVYIAQTTFNSLSKLAQESAKKIFGDALIITSHQIDIANKPGFKQALDSSRIPYQTFILTNILEIVEKRSYALPSYQGTFVTLPSSHFKDYALIPMAMSQSCNQTDSSDTIYIYWETLHGDMMLVLTNQIIDTTSEQTNLQCLTCHIAKWPVQNSNKTSTNMSNDYQEGYSYIGTHHPLTHYHVIHDLKFPSSSNTFHRGCNTDEYIIYNLVVNRKTSQVTLAIVGSNSLYNQQKLNYTFEKTKLDLNKLEYIQISAGGTSVPIRNFVVQTKPIDKYHPSIDIDFIKTSNASTSNSYQQLLTYSKSISKPKTEKLFTSKPLTACSDSIYCKLQYRETDEGRKHIEEYSHPCRFSELCFRASKEPHLVHIPHLVATCPDDEKCLKVTDPIHRAQFRHTNLPDYLVPCIYQEKCTSKSKEHKIKYFHGEKVPLPS